MKLVNPLLDNSLSVKMYVQKFYYVHVNIAKSSMKNSNLKHFSFQVSETRKFQASATSDFQSWTRLKSVVPACHALLLLRIKEACEAYSLPEGASICIVAFHPITLQKKSKGKL